MTDLENKPVAIMVVNFEEVQLKDLRGKWSLVVVFQVAIVRVSRWVIERKELRGLGWRI